MSDEPGATAADAAHTSSVGGYTVTVTPATFTMVDYEAPVIAEVAARLCERVGLPTGLDLRIDVNQTTPLGRAHIVSADPAVLSIESGGFEDNHRPRQFHQDNAEQVLGRLLLKLRDRRDPAFADAPSDDGLSLEQAAAWDAYATGRLGRLGYAVNRQRRLYQFRVRHGFSDGGDTAFARLWDGEGLSWAQISRISADAMVTAPAG